MTEKAHFACSPCIEAHLQLPGHGNRRCSENRHDIMADDWSGSRLPTNSKYFCTMRGVPRLRHTELSMMATFSLCLFASYGNVQSLIAACASPQDVRA